MSLIPQGANEHRPAYMEFNLFHGQQVALFDGRYKFVWDTRRKRGFYYDLNEDPGETVRLGKDSPEYAALFAKLELKRAGLQKTASNQATHQAEMDAETIKALQSLGYLEKAAE